MDWVVLALFGNDHTLPIFFTIRHITHREIAIHIQFRNIELLIRNRRLIKYLIWWCLVKLRHQETPRRMHHITFSDKCWDCWTLFLKWLLSFNFILTLLPFLLTKILLTSFLNLFLRSFHLLRLSKYLLYLRPIVIGNNVFVLALIFLWGVLLNLIYLNQKLIVVTVIAKFWNHYWIPVQFVCYC